jgi:hypothetical protein
MEDGGEHQLSKWEVEDENTGTGKNRWKLPKVEVDRVHQAVFSIHD